MVRPLLPALALALGSAAGVHAQSAQFITLPSGFQPVNISDDGRVVVGKLTNGTLPAMWTAEAGVRQLQGPEGEAPPGTCWSASADGSVIVGTVFIDGQIPFRWTAETGITPLTSEHFSTIANGYAVSDDGTVAAGNGSISPSMPGFIWDLDHGLRDLPAPAGDVGGVVSTLSGDGRYVAGSISNSGNGAFIRWDAWTLVPEALTLHDGTGQSLVGQVTDSNYGGDIVVGRANGRLGGLKPVIWTTTGLQFIGSANGIARRVTRDGLVVAGSTSPSGGAAWVWTSGLGVVDLKGYLREHHGVTVAEGLTLTQVFGISADGRTMCGLGNTANWVVRLTPARTADFNRDEVVDAEDLTEFLSCFEGTHLLPPSSADVNHDGMTDFFDLLDFLDDFEG